jgi:hypothetical protein
VDTCLTGEKYKSNEMPHSVCHFEGSKRRRNPAVDSGKKDASDHREDAFHNLKEKESHIQEANLRTRRAPQFDRARARWRGGQRARFYKYKLAAPAQSLGEEDSDRVSVPLFKEFCVTGSGHPSGFTYGWVSNDNENLYVKIEFTPDNTMDGDRDYAKVYVKVDGNIKEFKVSEADERWGKAEFRYSDKTAYQHKVYDFQIPLIDIGLAALEEEQRLDLAFAAYGTAYPMG